MPGALGWADEVYLLGTYDTTQETNSGKRRVGPVKVGRSSQQSCAAGKAKTI